MFLTLILRGRRFLGLSQSEWRRLVRFSPIATVLAVGGCDGGRNDSAGAEQGSVEWKIENAMSAAPEAIARGATIMGLPTGPSSSVTVLREGTNDWVCYPTSPNVPFDDPKCMNQAASLWSQAMGVGEVPAITTIGVAYMLSGGGTASVSDPSVREPPSGEEWRVDPPHVMLHFPPGALDSAGLPVRPDDGGPWVMWATTPWAHIMVPVGPAPESESSGPEPGTPEWNIRDAMSAAPAAVSAGATVVSWAAGAGSEREVLRTGANGWTCFPGSPVTPTDDPTCGNRAWSTWFDSWASRTRQICVRSASRIGSNPRLRPAMMILSCWLQAQDRIGYRTRRSSASISRWSYSRWRFSPTSKSRAARGSCLWEPPGLI